LGKFTLTLFTWPDTYFNPPSMNRSLSKSGRLLIAVDSLNGVIDFPNQCRSYDATRRAVRFWGSDSAIETTFLINEDALTKIQPGLSLDESGFLSAFDANRDLICAAAAKVYIRGTKG
jgi:Protein of unknown function (DUF1488)